MNEAIKLAIEKGGYVNACYMEGCNHWREMATSDPVFWVALGKALGWKKRFVNKKRMSLEEMCGHYHCPTEGACKYQKDEWLTQWHRLVDVIAEGKDINQFFNELINEKR